MDKVKKYISMSTPVTFKQITNSVLAYEKQFLSAQYEKGGLLLKLNKKSLIGF